MELFKMLGSVLPALREQEAAVEKYQLEGVDAQLQRVKVNAAKDWEQRTQLPLAAQHTIRAADVEAWKVQKLVLHVGMHVVTQNTELCASAQESQQSLPRRWREDPALPIGGGRGEGRGEGRVGGARGSGEKECPSASASFYKGPQEAKVRKRKPVPPGPDHVLAYCVQMLNAWFGQRDLPALERGEAFQRPEAGGATVQYSFDASTYSRVKPESHWHQAWHGTWFYAIWSILSNGVLIRSDDESKGHEFWVPGVFCSPNFSTAREYARAHALFGDGLYHRVVLELRVDPSRQQENRQRGGVQWVFPEDAVALHRVVVLPNDPQQTGEERLDAWTPEDEALPTGRTRPPPLADEGRARGCEGPPPSEEGGPPAGGAGTTRRPRGTGSRWTPRPRAA
ncbi:unnamed protein product [Prorocentrum cordatum]|uniref:Uncharacterized protein n=1 Tax=Prorocentrum cordatum TaxID=2364126 RepID=A0ABN9PN43_9DINO|nr:unnamed protein product [Polarella glacialis]